MIPKIQGASGAIDILINYLPSPDEDTSGLDQGRPQLRLDVSLFYAYLETVTRLFLKQGYGSIVNVSGIAVRDYLNYMNTRNEVIKATKTLGRELARNHIHMNAVIPCLVEGEDYHRVNPQYLEELSLYLPVQRPAKLKEIVGPILFLASDKAGYLFAETIRVDGGLSA